MTKILVINSSVRSDDSISRELTGRLADKIKENDDDIVYRDLRQDIGFISERSLNAAASPLEDRTPEDKALAALSDSLIEELELADNIIIGSPMYNFGPPASLKAWADLVARANRTFSYSDNGPIGLLKNKKAFIVAVTGGTGVHSDIDFMTPWLRHFLAFIGIADAVLIKADGVYADDGEARIKSAMEEIDGFVV